MFRSLAQLAVAVLIAVPLVAQQPYQERVDVSIVNVDVTVTARGGVPATGLTVSDFEVFEDGKPQPITYFSAVVNAASVAQPAAGAQPAVEQVAPGDERFRRKVLVLVDSRVFADDYNPRYNRNAALKRLEEFVDDKFHGDYEWSIAVLGRRLHMLLPMTADKQQIHDAINAIRLSGSRLNAQLPSVQRLASSASAGDFDKATSGVTGLGECALNSFAETMQTLENERMAGSTALSLLDAVRGFASTSGKKVLLLLAPPMSVGGADPTSIANCAPPEAKTWLAEGAAAENSLRDAIVREANASNVNVYYLNYNGNVNVHPDSAGYWTSRLTGGRYLPGNDPALSLAQFDESSSTFYSLGYRAPHGEDGRYHKIRVTVKRRGFELRYRDGYASAPQKLNLERTLLSSLADSLHPAASGVPVKMTVSAGVDDANRKNAVFADVSAIVPASKLQFLEDGPGVARAHVDFYISIFDEEGRNVALDRIARDAVAASAQNVEGDFVSTRKLRFRRGQPYRIVVAVRDQTTEAVGIVSQSVKF